MPRAWRLQGTELRAVMGGRLWRFWGVQMPLLRPRLFKGCVRSQEKWRWKARLGTGGEEK